jgi:hypothetical protein
MDANPQREKPPARGRAFRFSLRFLFVSMTIAAVYLGMLTVRARHQREVVAMVLNLGGQVGYRHNRPNPQRVKEYDFNIPPPGPAWLRKLIGQDYFVTVVFVYMRGTKVTDEQWEMISELPYLENLNLDDTQISEDGFRHLTKLSNLQVLWLNRTKIDDNDLRHLANLTKLVDLHLGDTQITDAGLVHLNGLVNLDEWLYLNGTQVSDAGLQHLRSLKKLDELILGGTKVTKEGARSLHQYLRDTSITFGEGSTIHPESAVIQ